jgi:diguanylate cyclase (GGDEF)-like protein
MKSAVIWSSASNNTVFADNSSHWSRIMALVSRLVGRVKSADLTDLRARMAALEQENAQLKYQLDALAAPAELARLAFSDCLTGLANRRALLCAAEREMARVRPTGRPACVVLVDIDHFKTINDDFGHAQGDVVLRLLAATLRAQTRTTDTLARWGGEEFALLLPETDLAAAQIVAEKCRWAVQALQLALPRSISITLGVSELHPMDTFDAALARADSALYKGKADGRNRVVVALTACALIKKGSGLGSYF